MASRVKNVIYAGALLAAVGLGYLIRGGGNNGALDLNGTPERPGISAEEGREPGRARTREELEKKVNELQEEVQKQEKELSGLRNTREEITEIAPGMKMMNEEPTREVLYERGEGALYFRTTEGKVTRFVPGSTPLAIGVSGGKLRPDHWNIYDETTGRDKKFYDGLEFFVEGDKFRMFSFVAPNGMTIYSAINEDTGEVVGNTATHGSPYDFGVKILRNSEGKEVPILWALGLDNTLAGMKPEVQKAILGPEFSGFRSAKELFESGEFGVKNEKDELVGPFPHQYSLILSLANAKGDGIFGGLVDVNGRINPNGEIRKEGEPSFLEAVYVPSQWVGNKSWSDGVLTRMPKPSLMEVISPIEVGGRAEIQVRGDQVYFSYTPTGDQLETAYEGFAPASGMGRTWNMRKEGAINGIYRLLEQPANQTVEEQRKK